MEQVPHIAMYCQEFKAKLAHVVPETLLPMVVKFLTDVNIQVRKTSQAALLVLLEQGLVEKSDVQEQVCPVILRLTEADALDDHRTEAVAVSAIYYSLLLLYTRCLLSRLFFTLVETLHCYAHDELKHGKKSILLAGHNAHTDCLKD